MPRIQPRREKKLGDSINFLYREFDRVLRKVKPKAFVVENVNGMAFGESRTLLENQLRRYRMAGYRVKWTVLNAAISASRKTGKEFFWLAFGPTLKLEYNFPEPTHGWGRKKPFVTQRDVLGGLPRWPAGEFNTEPFHCITFPATGACPGENRALASWDIGDTFHSIR